MVNLVLTDGNGLVSVYRRFVEKDTFLVELVGPKNSPPGGGEAERLKLLAGRAEQNFVDVDILRLADGEGDHARKRFG